MRKEKFDNSKASYESDDIKYAFECNELAHELEQIDVIVAEVCGENDGNNWYWILKMKDGKYAWAEGGCDYTGWDCQSSASIEKGFNKPYEAIEELPICEWDSRSPSRIRECLVDQIDEKIPFALFVDN